MPRAKTSSWLKGCNVCNVGLIKTMDGMIEKNKIPEAKAAKLLEAEGEKKAGGVKIFTWKALRDRYRYYKGKDKTSETPTTTTQQTQPQKASPNVVGTKSVPEQKTEPVQDVAVEYKQDELPEPEAPSSS